MIFLKFFIFFEKYFFEKSSRLVKVIFAAIDKSASRNFFRFENPEISAVCRPNFALRGGGQSARGIVFFAEKSTFFLF